MASMQSAVTQLTDAVYTRFDASCFATNSDQGEIGLPIATRVAKGSLITATHCGGSVPHGLRPDAREARPHTTRLEIASASLIDRQRSDAKICQHCDMLAFLAMCQ